MVVDSIARFCSNLPAAIIAMEVLGPPDIERRVGLTGGHIFQGEILPEHMWDRRLSARTPMAGVYLCGAGTHPGGSVIAHQRAQRGDGGAEGEGGKDGKGGKDGQDRQYPFPLPSRHSFPPCPSFPSFPHVHPRSARTKSCTTRNFS